jgi:aminopeptidase
MTSGYRNSNLEGTLIMPDPRLLKLADLLVHYCTAVRPGDWVLVRGHVAALPLIEATVAAVVDAGGNPTIQLESDDLTAALLRGSAAQLDWVSPLEEVMADKLDVRIAILAATNTRALTGLDPAAQQRQQNARRPLNRRLAERSAAGTHRWVGTLFPCPAFAQEADLSLADYEDFVYGATFADQPDPVAAWLDVRATQQRWVDWLKGKDQVVVRGPDVDLTLSIAGRTFINSDGKRNMPSGEIFTGPVEESVNGWIRFGYPALRGGREVDGVEFTFKDGVLVKASATKNEEYLLSQIASDPGAARLGEFALGTNYRIQRFTKNILYDEKIGGTMHVALGAGYPETGSRNQSAIHWDFICDMRQDSEIRVDGELLYCNGQFVV